MLGMAILVNKDYGSMKEKNQDLDLKVGRILRAGVWTSLFFGILGFLWLLLSKEGLLSFQSLSHELPPRFSLTEFLKKLVQGSPDAIMMLGVIALILTPLIRVIFALFAYANRGNKLYLIISLIVLVLIIVSVLLGLYL